MEVDLNYICVSHLRDFEDNSFNLEDLTAEQEPSGKFPRGALGTEGLSSR